MEVATHMLRTGRRGALFEVNMALRDLRASFQRIGLAWSLARHDIVSRYRGSILGPFWITLSMGLMVGGIGLLYARLFEISLRDFIPHVALGIVFFGLITGLVNEGCDTFVQASGMLSQTSLPMFTFVWRTLLRNLLNLAHHLVIVVGVLAVYGYWKTANAPLALAGLLLLILNATWASLLVGVTSARFRDVPQLVISVKQFAMFMTPVFWTAEKFASRHAVLVFNPFNHMLSVVRDPLLGKPVDPHSWTILVVMAVVGWALAFTVFTLTRRRIVHYL
jgi:ABC-type polysaccharide/polyol phosphate export permease